MEINSQLSYDLEALKRHIEVLQEKNNQVLSQISIKFYSINYYVFFFFLS